jgi:type I restriction enzyme S subunit
MTQTVSLGDIGKVITGKTPPKANPEYWGGELDFITPTDFTDSKYISPKRQLSSEGKQALHRIVCPANSVIVTCIGSDMGKVALARNDYISNQQINSLVIDEEKADPNFIYYLLKLNRPLLRKYAESGGSTMPIINKSTFERLAFAIPDLETQKKIADILGTIDEKIELNRQMNETLEQMGQALFRHYFIDNPEAEKWDTSSVGEYYDVVLGGTPSRSRSEYWQNGTVGWINSGKINEFRITEPSEYITEDALRRSAAKLLPAGTTVIAITGATLGQISRLEKEFAANQSVIGMVPKKELGNEYIYHWISYSIAKLIGHQTGGAQQHINRNNVVTFELPIPSQDTLTKFRNIIEPITNQISTNCFEIQTLTTLRDTLLPRLISGKVKV